MCENGRCGRRMGVKGMQNYSSTRRRYKGLINEAFDAIELQLIKAQGDTSISLKEIDEAALAVYRQQWGQSEIDWERLCREQMRSTAKRITLAIWEEEELIGLAFGKVSRSCKCVSISHLEKNKNYKGKYRGEIALFASAVAIFIGQKIGAKYASFLDVSELVVEAHYRKLGFERSNEFGDYQAMYKIT